MTDITLPVQPRDDSRLDAAAAVVETSGPASAAETRTTLASVLRRIAEDIRRQTRQETEDEPHQS